MKAIKVISALLGLFIYLPIAFYINFWVLKQLSPDRLIWFLFFINIPIAVFISLVTRLLEEEQ